MDSTYTYFSTHLELNKLSFPQAYEFVRFYDLILFVLGAWFYQ